MLSWGASQRFNRRQSSNLTSLSTEGLNLKGNEISLVMIVWNVIIIQQSSSPWWWWGPGADDWLWIARAGVTARQSPHIAAFHLDLNRGLHSKQKKISLVTIVWYVIIVFIFITLLMVMKTTRGWLIVNFKVRSHRKAVATYCCCQYHPCHPWGKHCNNYMW